MAHSRRLQKGLTSLSCFGDLQFASNNLLLATIINKALARETATFHRLGL
jgi:hypothetical protein